MDSGCRYWQGREIQSYTACILVTDHRQRGGGRGVYYLPTFEKKTVIKVMTKLSCLDIDSNNRIRQLKVKKINKQIEAMQLFVSFKVCPVGKVTCLKLRI